MSQFNNTVTVANGLVASVYPAGIQLAVSVTNIGANTLYVTDINVAQNGYPLLPNNSIEWRESRPLYLYTAAGISSQALIMEAGKVLPAANVSASVSGNVAVTGSVGVTSITAPVNVQGGGVELASGTQLIANGGTVNIPIPAPANGVTYFAVRLYMFILPNAGPDKAVEWSLNDGANFTFEEIGHLYGNPSGTGIFQYGAGSIDAVFPFSGTYPLTLTVDNVSAAGTVEVQYAVATYSQGAPVPVSRLDGIVRRVRTLVTPSGTARTVYLPASFTPYRVQIATSAAPTAVVQEIYLGTWQARSPGGLINVNGSIYEAVYPGHGSTERLVMTTSANAGLAVVPY